MERPAYGRRLMPSVLDSLAKTDANRLYAVIPNNPADVSQGFCDITVTDVARCTGGFNILHTAEVRPIVSQLEKLQPKIHIWEVPSFEQMLKSSPEHFEYEKTFDEARDDPVVILHSSGSTGVPKPITMTHGSFAVLDNEHNLPQVPGRKKRDWSMWTFDGEARVYTVFPFFHVSFAFQYKVQTIFMNASPVLGPPHMVPDGRLLKYIMLHQKLRSIFLPPAVIEQLLHEPDGINFFKGLDFLVYSGAPFNPIIGDRLSEVVEIISPFGSTEIYPQPELAPAREDWAWHEFNPLVKCEMQEYDITEGTFELVVFADESNKDSSALYHNLPGTKEYRTKDLFIRHPEKTQLFKYYGRRDDIIVLANGEKFNPIPLEVNVQNHPALKGVLVIGNGRTQAALLVEPKEALKEPSRAELVKDLWPLVEKSNDLIAGQGRIHHGMILCALPERPFTRTGKGTIVRKLTELAYEDDIENIYTERSYRSEPLITMLERSPEGVYESPIVVKFLRRIIALSFPRGAAIGEREDFFVYGLDSVQTLEIVANLKCNLQREPESLSLVTWITPRTIFYNPNIAELSGVVKKFLDTGETPPEQSDLAASESVRRTVANYVQALPKRSTASEESATDRMKQPAALTVVLLGSTGFLGSYLLANLLRRKHVSRVICLNRARDAQRRQQDSMRQLGALSLLEKVEYMTVDLGQPRLGLTQDDYSKLILEADIIIYNSWRLDFGLALRSFSPFLDATRELIDIAATSNRNPSLVFISSLSSVAAMARRTTVPEVPINSPSAAFENGYGQSKHAAERIFVAASQTTSIPISIIRVCQVGGPATEEYIGNPWADQPWISVLIKTSKALGIIPTHVTTVDWVPVDVAAIILSDIALKPPIIAKAQVYHICNPNPQNWDMMVDVVQEMTDVSQTAPLGEWVRKLRAIVDPSTEKVAEMPALKMLDYYTSLAQGGERATYETSRALGLSQVEVPLVDKKMIRGWLNGWKL
ncbi:acetyl-CoA synthetase-like protein [Daldinia decipiens]|uniref:acetyl-CoA synthetase-like protein n=1 Tax=Daldinia decipiens TaxID=326647 RepID=UPI0020C40265|nr:acetyl-CoA synthetase-like protein [Daldinia decipiens]KAI1655328.1 acetyl-CoA synthetase-like protein [Daldinia decipiens]